MRADGSSTPQTPADASSGVAMPKFDIPGESAARGDTVGAPSSRRWLPLLALAALLLFAGVGGALAWRQYRDSERDRPQGRAGEGRRRRDRLRLRLQRRDRLTSRGRGGARRPAEEQGRDAARTSSASRRGTGSNSREASPGSTARARCASAPTAHAPGRSPMSRTARTSARPIRNGLPFVSEGLTSRVSHRQVIVISVPTRDAHGEITGVLAGTLLVKPTKPDERTIDLGYRGLAILDRKNQLVFSGFSHPRSLVSLKRFGTATSGVLSDTDGARRRVWPRRRVRAVEGAAVERHPRSPAFRDLRRCPTQPRSSSSR